MTACTSHDFIVFPWQRAQLAQAEKGMGIKRGCLSFNIFQTRKSIDGKFSNDKLPPKRVRMSYPIHTPNEKKILQLLHCAEFICKYSFSSGRLCILNITLHGTNSTNTTKHNKTIGIFGTINVTSL